MLGPYKRNQVYTGDARELAPHIPDNSFDIIFTDPPYSREFIPLYGWLAETAARVLKPGGFLCAMAGGYHLAEIFNLMNYKGLDWYFKIEIQTLGNAPVIWSRRIVTRSKPVLLWTKGPGVINIWNMSDIYLGQGPNKRYHLWGQDVGSARYVIEYILGTGAPSLLWEPFAGGGATLEACKLLGVDFIAFEINPESAQIAQDRYDGVQRLEWQRPEQLSYLEI